MIPSAVLLIVLTLRASSLPVDQGHNHDTLGEQEFGTVHFPISCTASVQKTFERGVALLHSFAFDTAETVFRAVADEDPNCAMAYWGIASTFRRWGEPSKNQLERGWEAISKAEKLRAQTAREHAYISALAGFYEHPDNPAEKRGEKYLKQMEQLYKDFPDDLEVGAFYALALEEADNDNDPTHAKRKEAAAILEKLFVLEPDHPGVAHYLIHTYDYPGMAELGLPAARRYAKIAPSAPHALHMPSHIFARLGMWQEDIDSNLASIAASRNAAPMHMQDEGHQYHAMEFLIYAYLQCGRDVEAARLIEEVRTLPKMKDMYGTGFDPQIAALTSFAAFYDLELHHWQEAKTLRLISLADDADTSITYKARAIGAARSGDLATAEANLHLIEKLHAMLVKEKGRPVSINALDEDRRIVSAWIEHAEGRDDDAIKTLVVIAAKEQGTFAPDGGTPAHEMLGDIFMDMAKPQQALSEYEAELKVSPNRFNSLYGAGHASELSNEPKQASTFYGQLLKSCANADSVRPELLHARSFLSALAQQN